jgi:hypothetical protein
MARISQEDFTGQSGSSEGKIANINAEGQENIVVPSNKFIANADISREGQDLVLEIDSGETLIVNNYFSVEPAPVIESPDGSILTENLVNSFLNSSSQYAQSSIMNDESPVGAVEELSGDATVIRGDGSSETITLGTPIYRGDIIETSADGAVNILFIDETSMAVSENARMSIDEYEFDPSTESGETNLSVLRGVFVFTSGLIGRDDPDDVQIDTPVGSIGIRGTIIAGKIQPGGESEITVVEGAIVVRNGAMETTLSTQYETVKLSGFNDNMEPVGVKSAGDVGETYGSVSDVVPKLFSSINDSEKESAQASEEADQEAAEEAENEETLEAEESAEETNETENQDPGLDESLDPAFEENGLNLQENGSKTTTLNLTKEDGTKTQEPLLKHHRERKISDLDENNFVERTANIEAPTFNFAPKPLFEGSNSGDLVARVVIGNAPAGTTFTISGASAANYDLININNGVAEIRLSTAGQSNLDANTVGTNLGTATITATFANGDSFNWTIPSTIIDASVRIGANGGLNYDVDSIGTISALENIGDFDGDGTDDLVQGLPTAGAGNGSVNVIDGATNTLLHGTNGSGSGNFGESVAAVGDLNNDGFADIVGGAPNTTNGLATVIYGSDTTPGSTNIPGGATGDKFGFAITGLGDYDGADGGKSDFAASAINANAGGSDRGEVYIFTDNNTSPSTIISGHSDNMRLGEHVSDLGDINGDGLSDLIVSAQGTVGGLHEAYLVYGGDSTSTTGGLNKISTPHDIVAAGGAGDINGDGYDDFAVSLDNGSDINTYVVYGSSSQQTVMNLAFLEDPDNALKINHVGQSGNEYEIKALGDVDGDGFDDIQVGVEGGNHFVVHGDLGGNAVPYVTDNSASDGDGNLGKIQATVNGQSLVGNGDFNDNLYTGLSMKGGSGNNTFKINNTSFINIDGGKGIDTLHFGPTGLDFSAVDFEHVSQIEKIELGDASTNTLTVENIFNMLKSSDTGSLTIELEDGASGGNLDVDATGSANIVDALNEEGLGATQESSAGGFDHYKIGGYDLYIDQNITTNVV